MPTKGARTRARLLELAVERFATSGFRATSLSEIARQAGLTPAAAYAYFPSKEALFEAAVDADAAQLVHEALTDLEPGSPRDRILSMAARLTDGLERHPLARRVLAGAEPGATGRLVELPALLDLRRVTAEELRAGQRAGTIRRDVDPEVMALGVETVILAAVMAQLLVGASEGPPFEARRASVAAVVDAALRPPT